MRVPCSLHRITHIQAPSSMLLTAELEALGHLTELLQFVGTVLFIAGSLSLLAGPQPLLDHLQDLLVHFAERWRQNHRVTLLFMSDGDSTFCRGATRNTVSPELTESPWPLQHYYRCMNSLLNPCKEKLHIWPTGCLLMTYYLKKGTHMWFWASQSKTHWG